MPILRGLRSWQRLGSRQRGLLLEACAAVPIAWVMLRLVPFKRIATWLEPTGGGSRSMPVGGQELGVEIGWAVRAAASRLPGKARCLVQGLAAAAIARRRRVPATLYLGVAHSQEDRLEAHAWVRCGNRIITGRAGHRRFQVVERFSGG